MSEAEKLLNKARNDVEMGDIETATIRTRMAQVYATLEVAACIEAVMQRLDIICYGLGRHESRLEKMNGLLEAITEGQ